MKLNHFAPLTSLLVLGLLTPACGDDDSSNDDDTVETDDDTDDTDDAGATDDTDDTDDTDEPATDDTDDTDEPATDDTDDTDEPATDDTDEPATDDTDEPATDDAGATDDGTDDPATDDAGTTDDDPVETDDAGTTDDGPGPDPEIECPPMDEREIVDDVSADIDGDETWTCDKIYWLQAPTYVNDGATLTIQPGTVVWGDPATALVVARGGYLNAMGTKEFPIVMTSSALDGERAAGDWGGLVMLGNAPINVGDEDQVEGIDPATGRGTYGGDDEDWNCGNLSYVRVEFAGYIFGDNNELNGLSIAGCGTETTVDYFQMHSGLDDGVEIWGGAPRLSHILVSKAQDDSIDWDSGTQALLQFIAIVQDPADGGGDNGFECDTQDPNYDLMPRSNGQVYNFTIVGGTSNGLLLRHGTWGRFHNGIIMNSQTAAVDVRDASSVLGTAEDPLQLTVEGSLFFNTEFPEDDNDDGFDDEAFFTADARNNIVGEDPMLEDPTDLTAPKLVPDADSPAAEEGSTPPDNDFFDTSATYRGAFEPGGEDWTEGWTSFPEN